MVDRIISPAPDSAKPRTNPDALRTQLRWIAMDISHTAEAIERFNLLLIEGSEDGQDIVAYQFAIKALSQRAGWAADLAMTKMGEHCMTFREGEDSATAWMMPPAYHRDCQAREAS